MSGSADDTGIELTPFRIVFARDLPEQEGGREALCALGNGRFATRGATSQRWRQDGWYYPGTYSAGIYNRLTSRVGHESLEHEELVNLPNWLPIEVELSDEPSALRSWERLEYRRELDLAHGLLAFTIRLRAPDGRELRIQERRWVHLAHPHLAGQLLLVDSNGWDASLRITLGLDAAVENANADEYIGLDRQHLTAFQTGSEGRELSWLQARTRHSDIAVALAARCRVRLHGAESAQLLAARATHTAQKVSRQIECVLTNGSYVSVEKLVTLYTSRDRACSEPRAQALRCLSGELDFVQLERSHACVWQRLWHACTLELPGHERTLAALRLNLFHILQTVSPHTAELDTGVPARGLTGENYHGHVFWDELFLLPVLNLRWPELTRGLLLYRYRRLAEARRHAHALGLRGAVFPWRSASDGREVTEPLRRNPRDGSFLPDHSRLQRHINVAIVYNVWQYVQVTGDREFLWSHGAELIFSIALFWASAARLEPDGRYHLRGVVGPDEFHDAYPEAEHPGIDDNAYTNVMAAWCLLCALEVAEQLPRTQRDPLFEQLGITPKDVAHWDTLTRRMAVPVQSDGVILDQFAGFEQLEPFPWERYRERYGDIQRLDDILAAEGDSSNRYQVCKQADVLMLFYLLSLDALTALLGRLGYAFDAEAYRRNVQYYMERTSHGSTLSRVVHAWVLTRLDRERSWSALREALGSDLCDVQGGSTREGIHIGAMAGTLDIFQRAYLGLEVREDHLRLAPQLPPELTELRLSMRYRTQWLELHVSRNTLRVMSLPHGEGSAQLEVNGHRYELTPRAEHVVALES